MHRFLASAWYPFLSALILAAAVAGSFAYLAPEVSGIGQYQMEKYAPYAAWALGPVVGLLSLILAGIFNIIRRIVRLRKVSLLHPVIVFLSIVPWLIFAWVLTGENRYTPIARMIIDFGARPLLLGSLVTCIAVVVLGLPAFFPSRK